MHLFNLKIGKKYPVLSFITGTLTLNFLLFLPQFHAYRDMWKHIPKQGYSEFDSAPILSSMLIRSNFDIFRFQCDFLLVLMVTLLIAHTIKWPKILPGILTLVFVALFGYATYYEFSVRLYGGHPYFQNDLALALGVLPTFISEVGFGENRHILIVLSIFLMGTALIYLINRFVIRAYQSISSETKHRVLAFSLTPILIFGLIGHFCFPQSGYKNAWKTTQWMTPKILKSMDLPADAEPHTIQQLGQYQEYDRYKLEDRPNVYIYFMESYGAVPYFSPLAHKHHEFIAAMDSTLTGHGWYTASAYSKSPIIGGRSWLGFTTALSGIHLESQLQYNYLLEHYADYPHLTWWFNQNGYTTYRLKTMSDVKKSTARLYRLSDSFFGFDHWIKHADFNYHGFKYDEYFGGIPDQYAMDHFHRVYLDRSKTPYFTFFISMTSHIPWHPPPPIYEDYRVLNKSADQPLDYELRSKQPDIHRYHETIEYSLGVVGNYLTQRLVDDPNCIFVIIGDHQPPTLDYLLKDHISSFAVPIHVISRDSTFQQSLLEYEFADGMLPDPEHTHLNHSAFYSLMVNRLVNTYGVDPSRLPEVLDSGLE